MIGNDMIVYDKFGYQIKRFGKEDRIELFKYFTDYRLGNKKESSNYSMQRASLKMEVNEAINAKNHNPLGIYKNDELIGVCLSSISNKIPIVPKLNYINIKKEYMDGPAQYILFNFLINIMYEGESIKIKNGQLKKFGTITRRIPELGFSIFNNTFINNLNNYFKDK